MALTDMANSNGLIISVKEARKLLGKSGATISDAEVERIIIDLEAIARLTIRGILEGRIKIPEDYAS